MMIEELEEPNGLSGSIAKHIWGIPNWMADKALSYLPEEMVQVVREFYGKPTRKGIYLHNGRKVVIK